MPVVVSAIITTHNRKELLKRAIESVLEQTFDSIECIVVDDASTDGTREYIDEFIDARKVRYFYIPKEESKGGNYARNRGVIEAKGEYIAFLDDDDEWMREKISLQMKAVSDECGFVYTGKLIETDYDKLIDDSHRKKCLEGDLSREILIHILTVTSTILVKKELLYEVGIFDEKLRFWQEYDLCIRLLQKTKVRCVDSGLVLYRIISSDKKRLSNNISGWEDSVRYIEKKYKYLFDELKSGERAKRKMYIYIDGFNRAKKAHSYKSMLKYGVLFPIMHPLVLAEFIKKTFSYIKRKLMK